MKLTIQFRGVALFAQTGTIVNEVLFPNGETSLPPEGSSETIPDPRNPAQTIDVIRHADGSVAPRHYAGALLVPRTGSPQYRKLLGRLVQVAKDDGSPPAGANAVGNFSQKIPSLADALKGKFSLTLLPPSERTNINRVATRILLDGGEITATAQSAATWTLTPSAGGATPQPNEYYISATWTVDAPELVLSVSDLSGYVPEQPIVLNSDTPTVFLYHFDNGLPSVQELQKAETKTADMIFDNDFKWIYALLDRTAVYPTWKEWLAADPRVLPAPRKGADLIPISTCFSSVWQDA